MPLRVRSRRRSNGELRWLRRAILRDVRSMMEEMQMEGAVAERVGRGFRCLGGRPHWKPIALSTLIIWVISTGIVIYYSGVTDNLQERCISIGYYPRLPRSVPSTTSGIT